MFMAGCHSSLGTKGPLVTDTFHSGDLISMSFPVGVFTKKYHSVVMSDKNWWNFGHDVSWPCRKPVVWSA